MSIYVGVLIFIYLNLMAIRSILMSELLLPIIKC